MPSPDRAAFDGHRRTCLALVCAVLLYSPLLFTGLDQGGRRDWDQFSFRYETPRTALLRDHQLPLWNPYVNGGNVLLAHPNSPFPSPWYAIVLALGAPMGLRVQVVVFMLLGTIGMATLLRRWGVTGFGSFVGGVVFMMSAHFALHIAEGHLEWCVLGLMPWVMLGALRAEDDLRYAVVTGMLLSSVLMLGAVYVPAVYLPMLSIWILLESLRRRSWRLGTGWILAVGLMVVLSSVKLLPQLEFSGAQPRPQKVTAQGIAPAGVVAMFGERRQDVLYWAMRDVESRRQAAERGVPNGHLASLDPSVAEPTHARLRALGAVDEWHEYGAYVTWPGLALAAWGAVVSFRLLWPLYVAGALAFVVVLSNTSPIDLWSWLQRLPLYVSLTVPSRFLAGVVLVLAIAAAHGLHWIVRRSSTRQWLFRLAAYGIPIVIYVELAALGWSLWGDIFVYPRDPLPRHEAFAVRHEALTTHFPGSYSHTYPLIAANTGVLEGYENLAVPRGRVRIEAAPTYRGEVYLLGGDAVTLRRWSMAETQVDLDVRRADLLVLNQNFARGWRATIQGSSGTRVQRATAGEDGLVAVAVYEGDRRVTVFYRPDTLAFGAWVSGLGWVVCGGLCWKLVRRGGGQSVRGTGRTTA